MNFFYKIRYAETDQMGVVHHSNYALYLEQARIDWLSCKGLEYSDIEKNGVMLPVLKMEVDFKKPLYFGETVRVHIACIEDPTVRMKFNYKLYNPTDELVAEARVDLAFLSTISKRPMRCPEHLLKILVNY